VLWGDWAEWYALPLLCDRIHGRNKILTQRESGGHTKAASYHSFPTNLHAVGIDEAVKIAKLEYDNIKATHSFAREMDVQCDSWEGETLDVFYDEGQLESAKRAVQMIRDAVGVGAEIDGTVAWAKYSIWNSDEVRAKSGVDGEEVVGGVSYYAGSIHAYKFVCGVLKLCLGMGMKLFTETPVLDIRRAVDGMWMVETSEGIVRASRVILATNAYTAFLRREFQGSIVPLRGQVTVQRPGKTLSSMKHALAGSYSFIYKDGYDYMIRRPQGSIDADDLVIGGGLTKADHQGLYEYGNTDDSTINLDISTYISKVLPQRFGKQIWGEDHDDGRIKLEWSGIMGYSPDGYPFVGQVGEEKGLWVCAGFQGHGMVMCIMCAKALIKMVMGRHEGLEEWFPKAWEVSEERLERKFEGSFHVSGGNDV